MDESKLERSRRRWRIATACVSLLAIWLLSNAGETINRERETVEKQSQEIALLKQKLGDAAGELKQMSALLKKSQQVIQLFGGQLGAGGTRPGASQGPPASPPQIVPAMDEGPAPGP